MYSLCDLCYVKQYLCSEACDALRFCSKLVVAMLAIAEPREVLVPVIGRFSARYCRLNGLIERWIIVGDCIGREARQGKAEDGVDFGRIDFRLVARAQKCQL